MAEWTSNELEHIGEAEELQITSLRKNGTLRKWTTIWVVRVEDDLYVRSVYGERGAWYRGTLVRHVGHIRAGGMEKDVIFEEVTDPDTIQKVDEAYRTKYRRYPQYVAPLFEPESRDATLKLVVR
ncbi:MAG: DUF2255 family protein [candidate division Zixibacteria bacterium]|nr:DUF2255 family protein [Gammaproteobacteria bacterium]NIR65393.1 DUF2255 family protein [candidate division Zixibacteria bacterium]NIS47087.1 DUF2255 family protein [candidate division Zixibacteria bacterium]NIT51716.1 DUF2255 family protein [candidate division Zixibacteria bacterium]NIU15223.1 DUF2255 family protein [candidate division Zixibacteria bacterium]